MLYDSKSKVSPIQDFVLVQIFIVRFIVAVFSGCMYQSVQVLVESEMYLLSIVVLLNSPCN